MGSGTDGLHWGPQHHAGRAHLRLSVFIVAVVLAGCSRTTPSDFKPPEDWVVAGVVRSEEGEPQPSVRVSARSAGGGCLAGTYAEAVTDESGRYRLNVPRLVERASITASSGASARSAQVDLPHGPLDLMIMQTATLRGRITDSRGDPVSDALIRSSSGVLATSDASGNFELLGVERDRTKLVVTHRSHAQLELSVATPDDGLHLTLGDGVALRIVVRSSSDCPTASVQGHDSRALDAGVLEVTGLATDQPVELELFCQSRTEDLFFVRHELRPPIPAEVAVEVPDLRPVQLALVDGAGRGIPNASFGISATRSQRRAMPVGSLTTDHSGVIETFLPEGPLQLTVWNYGRPGLLAAQREWHGERVVRFTWANGPWEDLTETGR